jgi:hypothetical protein
MVLPVLEAVQATVQVAATDQMQEATVPGVQMLAEVCTAVEHPAEIIQQL